VTSEPIDKSNGPDGSRSAGVAHRDWGKWLQNALLVGVVTALVANFLQDRSTKETERRADQRAAVGAARVYQADLRLAVAGLCRVVRERRVLPAIKFPPVSIPPADRKSVALKLSADEWKRVSDAEAVLAAFFRPTRAAIREALRGAVIEASPTRLVQARDALIRAEEAVEALDELAAIKSPRPPSGDDKAFTRWCQAVSPASGT
jgi:hypothetical protein